MPKFEEETWRVDPQIEPFVHRGVDESLVGYLISSELPDGTEVEVVSTHGMTASTRDLEIATLFAASNDLYNAAEEVLPVLRLLYASVLNEDEQKSVMRLEAALARAAEPQSEHGPEEPGHTTGARR